MPRRGPSALWLLPTLLLAGACARETPDAAAEIRQADLDFAARTAAHGADGWADYFLSDGIMFPAAGKIEGREPIRAAMAGAFGPGMRLNWEPITVVAAGSGDLGYTIGRWSSVAVEADGADSITARGNYVTIWRRDASGRWRVAADIGNRDAAPDRTPH
jgi:ketosteroid isomerase-like protein